MITLSPDTIETIELELTHPYPVLYRFIFDLGESGYMSDEDYDLLCRARARAVIDDSIPRKEINFLICLFILEEQGK